MTKLISGRPAGLLFILLPGLFLAAFLVYPLGRIFALSLSSQGVVDLAREAYYWRIVWFTLWQAALSTLLTLALGLPAAYVFARFNFRGKSIWRALVTVPFVLPTVVVASAFQVLFAASGPANSLLMAFLGLERAPLRLEQSLSIILLAHVFYNLAVVIRLVGNFWANLGAQTSEAARVLGASPWRSFREVTLPLLRPALLGAALLTYLFSFTSFGVILILGGPRFSTLETEIYRQYVTFLRPDVAALLALLQIIFTFGLVAFYSHWQRSRLTALELRPQTTTARRPATRPQKLLLAGVLSFLAVFLLAPLAALAWRSLVDRDGQLTLAYYRALPSLRQGSVLFVSPTAAVRNSLVYAGLTVLVAGVLGLLASLAISRSSGRTHWLEPIVMIPLGASAVTLGLGYVVSYSWLRTSPLLVLIAHALVALPFVVRSLLPVLQGIRPRLREAAASLGASPGQVMREVDLPIVGRAMIVAAVFAFTVSMGEFGATSFIVRPNSGYLTMPIAIQRFLTQPGELNLGQSLAMSTILMLVCVVGFLAIERFRVGDIGEF